MTKPRRFFTGRNVAVIVALFVVALFIQPWSTPETRAYRIWANCGFTESETTRLIAAIHDVRMSREEAMIH